MRPRTLYVHVCLPDCSVPLPSLHQLQTLICILDQNLIQSFDVNPISFVLMDEHLLLFGLLHVILQQIQHVLVVKLQKRTVNFDVLPTFFDQRVKNVMNRTRNQAWMIFILLNWTKKRLLGSRFWCVWTVKWWFFYDIVPIAAKHRVCFATSSLAIGEDGDIKSWNAFFDDGFKGWEDLSLSGLRGEHFFKVLLSDLSWQVNLKTFLK